MKTKMNEEVSEMFKLLKLGGLKVTEIVFEGGISVKEKERLDDIQKQIDAKKAFGVVKLVYVTKAGEPRALEIPAMCEEEKTQEQPETA